jgi:hypothetical protein
MGNVFVDLQGLKDNHDFVADCCRYSENILSEEAIKKNKFVPQLITSRGRSLLTSSRARRCGNPTGQ